MDHIVSLLIAERVYVINATCKRWADYGAAIPENHSMSVQKEESVMPGMVGARVEKKRATAHVKKGHMALKRAIRKLVIARVLRKKGMLKKAAKARKAGSKVLNRALGHYTRATTMRVKARAKTRVKPNRRRMGGSGGSSGSGGFLGGILNTIGPVLGGILGGI